MQKYVHSENGSVMVLVLMVLMLISIFGVSALNTSDTELMVSANSRCYKQNILRAEGIIMEVGERLELATTADLKPDTTTQSWLTAQGTFDPEDKSTDWDSSNSGTPSIYNTNAMFAVVFEGVAPGSSLNMTGSQMWQYAVYGRSQNCNGDVGVVSGYRREF